MIPRRHATPFATRSRLAPRTSGCTSRWAGLLSRSLRIRFSPAGISDTPSSCARGLASEFLGPPAAGSARQRTVLRRRRRSRPLLSRPGHATRSRESDRVCPQTSRRLIAWVLVGLMQRDQGAECSPKLVRDMAYHTAQPEAKGSCPIERSGWPRNVQSRPLKKIQSQCVAGAASSSTLTIFRACGDQTNGIERPPNGTGYPMQWQG